MWISIDTSMWRDMQMNLSFRLTSLRLIFPFYCARETFTQSSSNIRAKMLPRNEFIRIRVNLITEYNVAANMVFQIGKRTRG